MISVLFMIWDSSRLLFVLFLPLGIDSACDVCDDYDLGSIRDVTSRISKILYELGY